MHTDKSQVSATPLSIPERLLKAKSLLCTIKLACLYKSGDDDAGDYWDFHETLEFAENIVGECVEAYELEHQKAAA